MIARLAKTLVLALLGLWLALAGLEIVNGRPVWIAWSEGSFFATLIGAIVFLVVAGLPGAALRWSFAAGLAATAMSGPLLDLTGSAAASYAIAATLAGLALLSITRAPLAPLMSAAAHLWSLTALARLQLGLGAALVDKQPDLFLPALAVWTVAAALGLLRGRGAP